MYVLAPHKLLSFNGPSCLIGISDNLEQQFLTLSFAYPLIFSLYYAIFCMNLCGCEFIDKPNIGV